MFVSLCAWLQINKVNGNPQENVAHANDDCLIEISKETAAPCLSLHLVLSLFFLGCGLGCNSNYRSIQEGKSVELLLSMTAFDTLGSFQVKQAYAKSQLLNPIIISHQMEAQKMFAHPCLALPQTF